MSDIALNPALLAAVLAFQAIPGAGTLAILETTARQGSVAGFGAVLGTLSGDLIYMLGAIGGLAALLAAQPALFGGLQWFGIAYLAWLGIGLLRPAGAKQPPEHCHQTLAVASFWRGYRRACAVSLSNPKVLLFFVAFFPPFLPPAPSTVQLAVLTAQVSLLSLLWQSGLVLLGNAVATRLRQWPNLGCRTAQLCGLALLLCAARLIADLT